MRQRRFPTLNVGFNATLPLRITASGFVNGSYDPDGSPDPRYPNPYLSPHTTFDLSLGKSFGKNITASVTANRRLLLDNSLTFGGFHYNDPPSSTPNSATASTSKNE